MRVYTGIGSRRTPDDVILLMEEIGEVLARKGWTLRSGAAEGADAAFEAGALRGYGESTEAEWWRERRPTEIYLPWPGYRQHDSPLNAPPAAAYRIAEEHHPNWRSCNTAVRRLMARNSQQVLGYDPAVPSRTGMVICWTPEGKGGGGTGQAIRVARAYAVPVWDLGESTVLGAMRIWIRDQTGRSGYV